MRIAVAMNRVILIAWAFVLSSAASVSASAQIHSSHRLLAIPVNVNNIPATFLIDTGAERSIIDSAFARRLGLRPSRVISLQRNFSSEESIIVTAEQVRIGPKAWSDVPLVTLDLSTLSRLGLASISGVLGTDLLSSMAMRLSFATRTARVIANVEGAGTRVPLRKVQDRYFVPVMIGSSTFEMLLDSGTDMTALSSWAWRTLPSSVKTQDLVEGIQSTDGPPRSLLACAPSLRLGRTDVGETVLHDQPIRVIMPSQAGSFADPSFAGSLGADVLERFEVTLDLQHASMYLKPNRRFQPDPYEFVTVGIQFFKSDPKAFSVVAVWKHSPAEEVGVVVGDRIVSVNGHSSTDLELEMFANQLHSAAGTPVVLEIDRPEGIVTLRAKTRHLVCESPAASVRDAQ
jgi:hypothetical protein